MKVICKHRRWFPEQATAKCKISKWSAGRGQRGLTHMYEKSKEKKCTFVDRKSNFLLLFLSCFSAALVPSMKVSPCPPLLENEESQDFFNNLLLHFTQQPLYCPFQYRDTCFQESLACLVFHWFTLNSPSQHQSVPSCLKSGDEFMIPT